MKHTTIVTTSRGERYQLDSDYRLTEDEIARQLGLSSVYDLQSITRSTRPKVAVVPIRRTPVRSKADDNASLINALAALSLGLTVETDVNRRSAQHAVNRSGRVFVYVANKDDKRGVYHENDECCARSDPRRRGNVLVHDKISLDRAEDENRKPCTRCW